MRFPPLVLVEWVDSHGGSDWTSWEDIEDHKKPLLCYSVGWIRFSNKENLTLVANLAERKGKPDQGFGIITIPTCAIRKVTPITNYK